MVMVARSRWEVNHTKELSEDTFSYVRRRDQQTSAYMPAICNSQWPYISSWSELKLSTGNVM